ncbi:MAG TPA: ribonuclease III [Stellaceae bacterium]|jgi:ribonuclease III|nr:ribonuclease III [Stellaceae bacterium]
MDEAAPGLGALQETLGHRFGNPDLLIEALTHPSASRRRGISRRGYERLEFLGDRVLGLIIAELVWRRFPEDAEGELTRRHAHLVRREALSEVAQALDLGARLIISKGEESAGVRKNKSVLADACEAVIAALYLDGGLQAVRPFIEQRWEKRLSEIASLRRDPKTALQEYVQGRGFPLPAYKVGAIEGPDHRRRFTVTVNVEGLEEATATASGSSKRGAEIAAAAAALSALGLAS